MDVIKHKWWYIAAIIILASVLVVLKKPYLPVGCQSGQRAPEVRFVYPPPTNPTNLLPSLLKEAGVKSYRNADIRTDRYFLCTNTSISIKLRNQKKLEIKMKEPTPDDQLVVEYWTKYRLTEMPREPTWNAVSRTLGMCETFHWIPDTGACEMKVAVDVTKKSRRNRIKLKSIPPRLLREIEKCMGGSSENHAVTVEYGVGEVIIQTLNGPKTVHRYHTVSVEEGPDRTLHCVAQELSRYAPEAKFLSFSEWLYDSMLEYSRVHFEDWI